MADPRIAAHPAPAHGQNHEGTAKEAGPEPKAFGLDAPAYVALAMVAVILIFLWKKVPSAIGKALDGKIETIRAQLGEAAQLRAEAEALKEEYRAKAEAADAERATILERARHEAEEIVDQAKNDTQALIERRARMAEDRIAAAERHAIDAIRARAANAAAAAAARLIEDEVDSGTDKALVDRAIEGLDRAH
jgi:F-type H+-transporting ATPase subunit b